MSSAQLSLSVAQRLWSMNMGGHNVSCPSRCSEEHSEFLPAALLFFFHCHESSVPQIVSHLSVWMLE